MKNNIRGYEKHVSYKKLFEYFPHGAFSLDAIGQAFNLPRFFMYRKDDIKGEFVFRWYINLDTGENVYTAKDKPTAVKVKQTEDKA